MFTLSRIKIFLASDLPPSADRAAQFRITCKYSLPHSIRIAMKKKYMRLCGL